MLDAERDELLILRREKRRGRYILQSRVLSQLVVSASHLEKAGDPRAERIREIHSELTEISRQLQLEIQSDEKKVPE